MLNTATSQNGFGNNRDIDVRLEMEPTLRLGLGPGMTDIFLNFIFLKLPFNHPWAYLRLSIASELITVDRKCAVV